MLRLAIACALAATVAMTTAAAEDTKMKNQPTTTATTGITAPAGEAAKPVDSGQPKGNAVPESAETHPAGGATTATAETSAGEDPWLWLEDVEADRSLAWARARNEAAKAKLSDNDDFRELQGDLLGILDSDAKIPMVEKIGAHYYNFWKDKDHARGIWRRATPAEYAKAKPDWETIIDVDALNKAEGENWVWHGAACLKPEDQGAAYERCLVALSRGGSDADVTREFDLETRSWVKDGFFRAEAKGGLGWIDRDHVYVFTDFGAGSMTSSGYPRIVKEWRRGQPLGEAVTVYEGKPDDLYIAAIHDDTRSFERDFVSRTLAFYNDELYVRGKDGKLTKIAAPNSASKAVHREWLTLQLREPWSAGGKTWPAGAVLVTRLDAFMEGKREFEALFVPSETTSLEEFVWVREQVVLNVFDDVKNRIVVATHGADGWTQSPLQNAPNVGSVDLLAVDPDESDEVFIIATDYLVPTTLLRADLSTRAAPVTLKTMPTFFDASKHVAEQHFTHSKDGTRIPYFVVRPKDVAYDGSNPTLLYGYGGFEVSLAPSYSGTVGKGWLEKGGVFAVANIRGGGEYGPRWHQAALKANRPRAYEDFAAVARDLVTRKITSPTHLGIQGGSNGGLLTGNMLVTYPELFGAVVIQVPLLDMKRYHKLLAGASWMAEYGDPDKPEEWAFIKKFSPYQLLRKDADYPPTLITTSTRDDRVHPGHARKFTARMLEQGHSVTYYENIEGGHGGAADNKQAAFMSALAYTFLWNTLSR